MLGACEKRFARRLLERTRITREPDFDVLRWQSLLSRLRKLLGIAARIASACAAMLRAILAIADCAIDVIRVATKLLIAEEARHYGDAPHSAAAFGQIVKSQVLI